VTSRKIALTIAAALASLLALCGSASAAPVIDGQFPLASPVDTNTKIAAGPDGNIWVAVHGEDNDVARVTPAGQVAEFELKEIENPSGIAAGPEGKIWVTATNKVASFSPSDPKESSKAFTVVNVDSNSPIVAGPDGQMWFAASEEVDHFSPSDPEGATPIAVAELSPRDIDVAGSLIAVADAGKPRIVTLTTAGVVQPDIVIGHKNNLEEQEGASQGLAASPSGQIGFSDPGNNPESIGLVTPPNPAQEFDRDGDPFGVAFGSDGAFWFALFGGAAQPGVERLTSTGEHTYLGGLKPDFGARQITAGPGNTMWMTAENNKTTEFEVARISGLEPPVVPISGGGKPKAPDTKIGKGPKKVVKTKGKRAKVTFRFSSSTSGATFECALVTVKKGKGKKTPKPKFKGCKSPKKVSLKPGKYRFSVRAVLAGVADPSPATKAFKVVHVKG
jgi:streptogramin lyase